MPRLHIETHLVQRIGWLRAAVLGANDGIISTASLILGVAAAAAAKGDIMLATPDETLSAYAQCLKGHQDSDQNNSY